MINYPLAPYLIQRLVADIGSNKYRLLLDESRDVSVSKYLGVVIHYFFILILRTQTRQFSEWHHLATSSDILG